MPYQHLRKREAANALSKQPCRDIKLRCHIGNFDSDLSAHGARQNISNSIRSLVLERVSCESTLSSFSGGIKMNRAVLSVAALLFPLGRRIMSKIADVVSLKWL